MATIVYIFTWKDTAGIYAIFIKTCLENDWNYDPRHFELKW